MPDSLSTIVVVYVIGKAGYEKGISFCRIVLLYTTFGTG